MGCCESRERNNSYVVTTIGRRGKLINSKTNTHLNKNNIHRIAEFLEIGDTLKLLKLNRKIRDLLPEHIKVMGMLKKLNEKKENELDLQSLLSDISE